MAERPPEAGWLYNQPTPGIVENWFIRNQEKISSTLDWTWILDSALVLAPFYKTWNGVSDSLFRPSEVYMRVSGPSVPEPGSDLWKIWQDYTNSEEGKADRNDPKMHLYSYRVNTGLGLVGSEYDWHRMRLGLMLRDGELAEEYRDAILPTREDSSRFVFKSEHPNNTNSHCVVITSDNHLVLATRGQAVDYYAGYTAASVEQQTNPVLENSPFATFYAAASKLNAMKAELNLSVIPESLRLGALFLEPDVNCVGFLVVGQVEEDSSQINPGIIGKGRTGEFAVSPNSIWTLPLDQPDKLVEQFHRPEGFKWHGTARLRIVAALSYIHGYEKALDLLYKAS